MTIPPTKLIKLPILELLADTNKLGLLDASASIIGISANMEKNATNVKYFMSNTPKPNFITNNVVA